MLFIFSSLLLPRLWWKLQNQTKLLHRLCACACACAYVRIRATAMCICVEFFFPLPTINFEKSFFCVRIGRISLLNYDFHAISFTLPNLFWIFILTVLDDLYGFFSGPFMIFEVSTKWCDNVATTAKIAQNSIACETTVHSRNGWPYNSCDRYDLICCSCQGRIIIFELIQWICQPLFPPNPPLLDI